MSFNKDKGPPAEFFESPRKTGWLTKLGGSGLKANWRRRYVVLDHHYLFYYKSDKDKAPCGNICLPEYDIVARADMKECKKPNAFMITSSDNIAPGSSSDCKRVYYMYADTEEECHSWSSAIEEEMIATIDPKQRHYFTLQDMGLLSPHKNGYQDTETNFDDLTTIVEDGQKLEHVTAQRPKKPHTRAPSRGHKDFDAIDDDDISSFALSPASAIEQPSPTERKAIQRRVSPLVKPMKPPVPSKETTKPLDQPVTKPKPALKPKNLMKHSMSQDSAVSPTKPQQRTQQKSANHEILTESAPVPTPRRTAPPVPDPTDATYRQSVMPPTPPCRPLPLEEGMVSSLEPESTPRIKQQELTHVQSELTPVQLEFTPVQPKLPPVQSELTPVQPELPPVQLEFTPVQPKLPPVQSELTPVQPELPPVQLEFTPVQPELTPVQPKLRPAQPEVTPPLRFKKSLSLSSGSKHSSVGSNPDTNLSTGATRLSGSLSKRSSSSSNSSSGSSDNVYQVPRNNDPIYQVPSSAPIPIQEKPDDYPIKIPIRKLHSVGHTISTSPRLSTDSTNYSNIVTDYLCSSPSLNTPPVSPIPSHKPVSRNYAKSVSMPRNMSICNLEPTEDIFSRRLSSESNHSANAKESNNHTVHTPDTEVPDRILSQISELEDQLIGLTTSSPRRGSLSPRQSHSNALSQIMNTEAQKLIDSMRLVVYEAISFHKQASEELQSARTEKRLAEKARQDAELNTQNIQTLLSTFQQRTGETTYDTNMF